MLGIFSSFADYLKHTDIVTDNAIFRLTYKFTTVTLIVCSVFLTLNQYFGDAIDCITTGGVPGNIINTYCWISSTFTMPDAHNRKIGQEIPHPGVGNPYTTPGDSPKYHLYYQWVVFVLFFQACFCYAPRWIWGMWEGNLMETLVMGLNHGMLKEEEKESKKNVLIDYMLRHIRHHNMYAIRYFFCEFLAFFVIVFQMYTMNKFLGGEFMSYGSRVLHQTSLSQEERFDAMIYVFPRVTKCTFHKFGPSGTIEVYDSMCILPLNIVNEKTFIFLWFWFIVLSVLLGCLIVYRLVIMLMPGSRSTVFHFYNRLVPKDTCNAISRKTRLGDWWILFLLGSNLDPLIYREVLSELAKKIETADSNRNYDKDRYSK